MNASDIVNSNTEKTTMDAFNNACKGIRAEIQALEYTASLCHEFGNEKLASKLEYNARELEFSVAIVEKYVTELHQLMYERGNESSQNLFNLGMGLAKIIDGNNRQIKE